MTNSVPPTDSSLSTSHHASKAIQAVAGYEIVKGLAALLMAVAVFIWHTRLPAMVAQLVQILHHIFGHFFVQALDNFAHQADLASQHWQRAFWFIIGYAVLRFAEAYGLYKDKIWAYWYSVLGYGIFIPVEVYAILTKPFEWLTLLTLLLNVLIVIVVYRNMKQKGLI